MRYLRSYLRRVRIARRAANDGVPAGVLWTQRALGAAVVALAAFDVVRLA